MSREDDADAWKKRWAVLLRCRDCEAVFECTKPNVSLDRQNGFNRVFLAGGPEVCPECKNLKPVTPKEVKP